LAKVVSVEVSLVGWRERKRGEGYMTARPVRKLQEPDERSVVD
jgi:hypothetical protein